MNRKIRLLLTLIFLFLASSFVPGQRIDPNYTASAEAGTPVDSGVFLPLHPGVDLRLLRLPVGHQHRYSDAECADTLNSFPCGDRRLQG